MLNRRGFIQRCFAGVAGAIVAFMPGKVESTTTTPSGPTTTTPSAEPKEWAEICFHGYRFLGHNNEIMWMWIPDNGDSGTKVVLPTFNRIRYFHVHEDKLFWVGEHETWEIKDENYDLEFRVSLKSYHPLIKPTHGCDCYKTGKPCTYPKHYGYKPNKEFSVKA